VRHLLPEARPKNRKIWPVKPSPPYQRKVRKETKKKGNIKPVRQGVIGGGEERPEGNWNPPSAKRSALRRL